MERKISLLQEFVAVSRYARWLDDEGRRENWGDTVLRYVDFMNRHTEGQFESVLYRQVLPAIEDHAVMPSMRALMTAGPALEREGLAGFNCAYIAINHKRKFAEALYILMCGTGVGFSCERQEIQHLPTVPLNLQPCDDIITVGDSKDGWAKAYRKLVSCLYDGDIPNLDYSNVRPAGARLKIFGGRACLTGDTIVSKDRKKTRGYNEITIRELFDMQNSDGFWQGKPNHFNKVRLRSLDEATGEFYRNRVLAVVDNGVAPVYEILTEHGYRIRATGNHRFLREDGEYQEVSEFSEGDLIAVNGQRVKAEARCRGCMAPISPSAVQCKACYDKEQTSDTASGTSARQRKACVSSRGTVCTSCSGGGSEHNLQVHHIDRNPLNNESGNLVTLCESCHRKLHAREDTIGDPYSHRYLSFDTILSIRYAGIERVYDLCMEAPNHNFVANGFVSHNSGPKVFRRLCEYTVSLFKKAKGRKLNSLEVHDLMCTIGEIVVVGGVRRSALISLSNLSDLRMREAKTGQWYTENPQRALANNSVAYTEMPNVEIFMEEWLSLIRSKSGERGIFNREAAQKQAAKHGRRPADYPYGVNPCLHPDSVIETVHGRVRIADIKEPVKVYTMLEDGTLGVAQASAAWISKRNAKTLVVTVSSGHSVCCTPDHLIFTTNRGWVKAKNLHVGDYVSHLSRARRGASYAGVRLTTDTRGKDGTCMEHILVWEGVHGPVPAGHDIHHLDGDTYNNDIDNLQCMKHEEHARLTALEQPNDHGVQCPVSGDFVSTPWSRKGQKTVVPIPEHLKSNLHQYARVVSVATGPRTDVYDLTVEGTHNMIADFVVVHNCAEILLRDRGLCNLTEVVIRPDDTLESLTHKVSIATILGTLQSTITNFGFVDEEWKKNAEMERLLGVSLTGIYDHPTMSGKKGKDTLIRWLKELHEVAWKVNQEWSEILGIAPSAAITCVKPSGCQKESTLLVTSDGVLTFGEIGDVVGDQWQDHSISVRSAFGMPMSTKFYVNGTAPTVILKMASGVTLEATRNHRYQVFNGTELVWVASEDIEVGDCMPYVVDTHTGGRVQYFTHINGTYNARGIAQPVYLTEELAWLLGLYYGDGSTHKKGVRISGSFRKEEALRKAARIFKDVFDIDCIFYPRTNGDSNLDLYANSTELVQWLSANGIRKEASHELSIPECVRRSPAYILSSFIDGLWHADGCTGSNQSRTFCTVSRTLAEQLVVCLRATGTDASMREMPPTASSWGERMRYWVNTKKGRSGLTAKSPDRALFQALDAADLDTLTPDFVVSVTDGECETFDIEVPAGNQYLANTYISHNTVSQLVDSASGIHPRHSAYYLRTVRLDKKDPMCAFMSAAGVYSEDALGREDTTAVFYFPVKSPEGAVLRDDINALEHLALWSIYHEYWCDHNPSITITVRDKEWFSVGAWVYENFDKICGISFLPHSDHVYQQAPYIEVTKEQYDDWVAQHPVPEVDWALLSGYEKEDNTVSSQTLACQGGVCDLI